MSAAVLALAFLLAPAASAAGGPLKARERGAAAAPAAKKVPPIEFEQFELANGLKVILSRDATVPVVAQAMIFNVGGRQETPGRSGFAHLFEHMMFEGSRHVRKGEFDRILEAFGGDNNASTHMDFTFYYEEIPSNALPVALWLDADRVGALKVSRRAVRTQIEVVKEERRMLVDNEPYGPLLYLDIASHTFSNWHNAHPTIGSYEDLSAAGIRDVRRFFKEQYRPANAAMAIVGDIDLEETRRLVTDYFGDIPNRAAPQDIDTSESPAAGGRTIKLEDPLANLPALAISWKGMPERGTRDYYALTLLGTALFAGKSSRLYQGLVKKSQAAVYADGGLGFPISDYTEYKAPGIFGAFVIHKAERTSDEIKALVLKAVRKVASSGLKKRELRRIKTKFRADWIAERQTNLGRARMLLIASLLDGDPGEANRQLDRFLAVTSGDIRRAAAKYLRAEDAMIFEVGAGGAK